MGSVSELAELQEKNFQGIGDQRELGCGGTPRVQVIYVGRAVRKLI